MQITSFGQTNRFDPSRFTTIAASRNEEVIHQSGASDSIIFSAEARRAVAPSEHDEPPRPHPNAQHQHPQPEKPPRLNPHGPR